MRESHSLSSSFYPTPSVYIYCISYTYIYVARLSPIYTKTKLLAKRQISIFANMSNYYFNLAELPG